jgi:hypothetical protein
VLHFSNESGANIRIVEGRKITEEYYGLLLILWIVVNTMACCQYYRLLSVLRIIVSTMDCL